MADYQVSRDRHGRLAARLAPDCVAAIQTLSETDERRIRFGVHAIAVLDVETALGVIRIRNVQVHFDPERERYYVRWYRHPVKGGSPHRNPTPGQILDVAGPLDAEARKVYNGKILDLFHFIRQECQAGKNFPHQDQLEV